MQTAWPGQCSTECCTRALKLIFYKRAPSHFFCNCGADYSRREFWETYIKPRAERAKHPDTHLLNQIWDLDELYLAVCEECGRENDRGEWRP